MSQENYTQEIFNQQLIIEASGHVVGLPGKVAYSLLASTKDGVNYFKLDEELAWDIWLPEIGFVYLHRKLKK